MIFKIFSFSEGVEDSIFLASFALKHIFSFIDGIGNNNGVVEVYCHAVH